MLDALKRFQYTQQFQRIQLFSRDVLHGTRQSTTVPDIYSSPSHHTSDMKIQPNPTELVYHPPHNIDH